MNKRFSVEEVKFIRDNYGRISTKEMAEKLGRNSNRGVENMIHKLGLSANGRTCSPNVDISFFEDWSQELAYVVGFFLADGHMADYSKTRSYNICFSVIDKDIIEKIAKVCGYKYTVKKYIYGTTIMYSINISGRLIWEFFESLGFTHNKTFTTRIPKQIPQELMHHFIRGVFDGDGSVCFNKTYPQADIAGFKLFIDDVSKVCTKYNLIRKYRRSFIIEYNGQKAIDFLNYIYKDSTIHMDRKYKRYLKALKWRNSRSSRTDQEIELLENLGPTTYAVDLVNVLNRPFSGIIYKATKLNIKIKEKRSKLWGNDEIQLLKELYSANSAYKMVIILNRSQGSIRQKAYKLGLKRNFKGKGIN